MEIPSGASSLESVWVKIEQNNSWNENLHISINYPKIYIQYIAMEAWGEEGSSDVGGGQENKSNQEHAPTQNDSYTSSPEV